MNLWAVGRFASLALCMVAFTLPIAFSAFSSDWVVLQREPDGVTSAYDRESVKRDGQIVQVITDTFMDEKGKDIIVAVYQLNCAKRTYRIIAGGRTENGEPVERLKGPTPWGTISHGALDLLRKAVCTGPGR